MEKLIKIINYKKIDLYSDIFPEIYANVNLIFGILF